MPTVDFDSLPDDARLWIFGARRALEPDEVEILLTEVDAHLAGWEAHGAPLRCGRDWRHDRFLLVAVDPSSTPPSGCSIDAMVRVLKGLEERLDVGLVDNAPVWYRAGDEVRCVSRREFARLARSGDVDPGTVVFDPTVTRLAQLRRDEWETTARAAWHGPAFFGCD